MGGFLGVIYCYCLTQPLNIGLSLYSHTRDVTQGMAMPFFYLFIFLPGQLVHHFGLD